MNPGDEFAIAAGRVEHRPGASSVAVMDKDDSAAIAFDPTVPVPPLADPNPDGASVAALRQTLDPFLAGLTAYAQASDTLTQMYRRRGVSYALSIVFPDGAWDYIHFNFHADGTRVTRGAAVGDVVHRIAASALAAWIEHRKSLFYVRAYSRRHQTVYDVADGPGGADVRPRPCLIFSRTTCSTWRRARSARPRPRSIASLRRSARLNPALAAAERRRQGPRRARRSASCGRRRAGRR